MSIVQFASDDEIDSQIQALNNAVDGLSLVIAQQRQVMRQALDALCLHQGAHPTTYRQAITALRTALAEQAEFEEDFETAELIVRECVAQAALSKAFDKAVAEFGTIKLAKALAAIQQLKEIK